MKRLIPLVLLSLSSSPDPNSSPSTGPKNIGAIVEMVRDNDADVRSAAVAGLLLYPQQAKNFVSAFELMLKDENAGAQASALLVLHGLQVNIPREELLTFLKSSNAETLDAAWVQIQEQGEKLSDDDSLALLNNPLPAARLLGLGILGQNPGSESIELALPFLRDKDEFVRLKASETLQVLTSQHFTADQARDWTTWWDENKAHFQTQQKLPDQM